MSQISKMLLFEGVSDDVSLFLTILVIVLLGGLIFLTYVSIKKERLKFAEDKMGEGSIDKAKLMTLIAKKVNSGMRSPFCLIKIDLNDIVVEKTKYSTSQNDALYKAVSSRIMSVFGDLSKICKDDDGGLLVYNTMPTVQMNVNAHCKFLCDELSKTFMFSDAYSLDLSFNIAAVKYPQTENTVEALLKNLDMAMAVAKRNGTNTYVVNSMEIEMQNTEEYRYFKELKDAIERKEFLLYYQPMINFATGEIYGYESLLRWNHSTLGVLSPASFLRILEQTGDINWVGFWAFERLLEDFTDLLTKYPSRRLTMYMNLSARQLSYSKLLEEFKRLVKKHKVSPQNICFDIAETEIFSMDEDIRRNIDALKMQGFKIAIDNYGVDASSLTKLEKTNIDAIKLDKTVLELAGDSSAMSKNILDILQHYTTDNNILLVSLGIENADNVEFAKSIGIKYGQGYYFSMPKAYDQAQEDMLKTFDC